MNTPAAQAENSPSLFLDAPYALIQRGDFDEGMQLAISSLDGHYSSSDERSWRAFCAEARAQHPLMRALSHSAVLLEMERRMQQSPCASLLSVWQEVRHCETAADDIVGHAIDLFLRSLPTDSAMWDKGGALCAFFECVLCFGRPCESL